MAAGDTTPKRNPIRALQAGWRRLNLSTPQVLVILGLVVGITLILDFTQRIQEAQRIVAEADALREERDALLTEQEALLAELEYVESDDYVVEWAHTEGRYVRQGEVLVIPVLPDDATPPTSTSIEAPPADPPAVWELWFALFFE